jgi:plasmid stabilization system protein ParE
VASVALHPSAQREYQAAVGWYQQRSQAAARRFVAEVDRALAEIGARPDRYGWYDDEFREAVLRRYPYSVVYRVEASGDVLVVAVAHASREPGYWQDRA